MLLKFYILRAPVDRQVLYFIGIHRYSNTTFCGYLKTVNSYILGTPIGPQVLYFRSVNEFSSAILYSTRGPTSVENLFFIVINNGLITNNHFYRKSSTKLFPFLKEMVLNSKSASMFVCLSLRNRFQQSFSLLLLARNTEILRLMLVSWLCPLFLLNNRRILSP